jgi:aspartyl-tRNA(Asn)/glutamyl-tRNA(Gln) amidotransferase subunit B
MCSRSSGPKAAIPRALVEARGMKQVTDTGAIEKVSRRGHRRQPRQGRAGQGQADHARLVCRAGHEGPGGKANPAAVNDMLKAKLGI